jgi:hypothetical protein
MGRPKKPVSDFIAQHWHPCNEVAVSEVGTACKQQFAFFCTCMLHKTIRTVEAVTRNPDTLLCGVCDPTQLARAPSQWELKAYAALKCFWKGDFMTEVKVLKQRYSAADIVLHPPNGKCTIVMIDGEQHFRCTRRERDHNAQSDTDATFNVAALQH